MTPTSQSVQRTYLLLTLLSTLAASLIWGINTIFLLDAGLTNTEAFAANAFFTAGQVLFEVPTGVVADVRGRRLSYALGAGTLLVTTLAYVWLWQIHGPFWAWSLISALLGLGFTFFSGATEAWLVDALTFTKFDRPLESVFAKGQAVSGAAMLVGSVAGGLIAQVSNLGVPYLVRAALLFATVVVCLLQMRDLGFSPATAASPIRQVRLVLAATSKHGWRQPSVRWLMLGQLFTAGVGFYLFYAIQPFLLQLYGDPTAYSIAGLAAAIIAGSQIVGGLAITVVRRFIPSPTLLLLSAHGASIVAVILLGLTLNFYLAIGLLMLWALVGSLQQPVRQSYLNGLIESKSRATILSFDALMGSSGGVIAQPILGKVADLSGYATSYLAGALIQLGALPFLIAVHRRNKAKQTT